MFGWEFPPFSSGGLGTACLGITKGLSKLGASVIFVIPKMLSHASSKYAKLIAADAEAIENVHILGINSALVAYATSESYHSHTLNRKGVHAESIYGANLFQEVERYALQAASIAKNEDFDIIHCHDWMTYKAGINAKKISGKKLIAHIHATEFDRSGGNPNPHVYQIEKAGFEAADKIIAVSRYTKSIVMRNYGIHSGKIEVVHNAVDHKTYNQGSFNIRKIDKLVLFLGRVTLQKGPDYFIQAARKVSEKIPNTKFVMAGDGDMLPRMIDFAAHLGIADKILFTGMIKHEDADKLYKMADLYIMPSVSEPFGITTLEAIKNGTPVIISKQSGVSEVITHALKVDFWDINEMANKIIAALTYSPLHETLKENSSMEVHQISWENSAKKILEVYANA